MRKILTWFLVFVFVFSYFTTTGLSTEDRYEVIVLDLQGEVKKESSNPLFRLLGLSVWEDISTGDHLKPGDKIKIGEDSSLELKYNNGIFTHIREKSLIEIGQNQKNTATLKINKGRLWVRFKKAWNELTNFRVVTPSAVAGVKGTLFSVAVEEDTILSVQEGLVQFVEKKNNEKVLVEKGMMSSVSPEGKLDKPRKINQDESKKWNKKAVKSWIKESKKDREVPGKALGHDKNKNEAAEDKENSKGKGNNVKKENNNGKGNGETAKGKSDQNNKVENNDKRNENNNSDNENGNNNKEDGKSDTENDKNVNNDNRDESSSKDNNNTKNNKGNGNSEQGNANTSNNRKNNGK